MKNEEIKPHKKDYTSKEAAEVLGGKADTFNRKAKNSSLKFTKCTDKHWRGTLKDWEKLLGLIK